MFSHHSRGPAVQVLPDLEDSTIVFCCSKFLWNSLMYFVMNISFISKLKCYWLDG
jgi:hypothetical protein